MNVKVGRLSEALSLRSGDVSVESAGFDATLFEGRLSISSNFAKTADENDTRDFRDPQLRERDQPIRLADTSRRTRFAAKVIDTHNLRLLVDGEFGETSEGFANSISELSTGRLILPGSWSTLSSQLEFGEAKVKVDYQDFLTREESLKRQGVTLGYASSELSIYRKEGMEFNLTQGGQWLKRTNYTGVTADILVADVIPSAVADAIDPASVWFEDMLRNGVGTIHVLPGNQTLLGGTGMVVRPAGRTVEDMAVSANTGIKMSLYAQGGGRLQQIRKLRRALDDVREYHADFERRKAEFEKEKAAGAIPADKKWTEEIDRTKKGAVDLVQKKTKGWLFVPSAAEVDEAVRLQKDLDLQIVLGANIDDRMMSM